MQRPELPTIRGCPIYVHNALRLVRPSLHPRYFHCAWRHHQHAMQHWVDRATLHWPWQAANARSAMVVWLGGHQLSESCPAELLQDLHRQKLGIYDHRAGVPNCSHLTSADRSVRAAEQRAIKSLHRSGLPMSDITRSKRMFWEQLMRATATPENRRASGALPQLRATAITTSECQRPYGSIGLPADVILVTDRLVAVQKYRSTPAVVAPFVVSRPPWLVGEAPSPPAPPWLARKLLFFAGHVPKLTISKIRYLLWRQLRRSEHATTVSHTAACTIGSYRVCRSKSAVDSSFRTYCHAHCRDMGLNQSCAATRKQLRRECQAYKSIDFDSEVPDMIRDQRRLDVNAYLRLALLHRFCLVARGDFASTRKIAEAVALGAAGGCLPVIVVPEDAIYSPRKDATPGWGSMMMLPYARWFPYCAIGFVVYESVAGANFSSVVQRLLRVTAAEAAEKRAALRRLMHAFVVRENSRVERPTAAEYVLEEVCHEARRKLSRHEGRSGSPSASPSAAAKWMQEAGAAAHAALKVCAISV